ncbi:biliverdin-producing heme oxygenase [Rhodobacterales bacterium]|nr:biliverdin-producing heme oxygenase [Rhodobacterales bacterium]
MQLLQALREATTPLHEQLDLTVSEHPISTRLGYSRFLHMHASVIPAAESWLIERPEFQTLPDASERLRGKQLKEDLDAFDMSPPSQASMSFLNDDSSVAGICYVLEGSRLGAAHLSSLLKNSGSEYPTAFLRHGRERSLWKSYLTWLGKQDFSPTATETAAQSARLLFEVYLKVLQEHDHNRKLAFGTS